MGAVCRYSIDAGNEQTPKEFWTLSFCGVDLLKWSDVDFENGKNDNDNRDHIDKRKVGKI